MSASGGAVHLVDLLDVRPDGDGRFAGVPVDTADTLVRHETSLAPRLSVHPDAVRADLPTP